MKNIMHLTLMLCTLLAGVCTRLQAEGEAKEKVDPAQMLEQLESKIKDGNINGVLEAANYAKNNGLKDDADRLFNQAIGMDAFNVKAHTGLGHKKLMDCWVDESEYKDFMTTLEEEKNDPAIKMIRKMVYDNNTQIGREALKKLDTSSRAWSVDTAFSLMEQTEDVFMEDICIDIFSRWAGDRARDKWLRRVRKTRNVGGAIKMLGCLQANMSGDLENPVTKFILLEVLSQRNENISLKCLDLLAGVKNDEICEALRKFLPRCNNQNVKSKVMSLVL